MANQNRRDKTEIAIPLWLLERAIQCLARAEVEKAFDGCVIPNIGANTLQALESYIPKRES